MNKIELLKVITENGWDILQEKQTGEEAGLKHLTVAVSKADGDIIMRKWIPFYEKDGVAYWQERNPFLAKAELTDEQIKVTEINTLIAKAKTMSALVEIGLEEQASFDAIKTEYIKLKE